MTRDAKKLLKFTALAFLFIFIFTYILYRSYDLVFGVKINDVNLINGETYNASLLKVSGNAKNATLLTLNGREISIDKEGDFEETIALLLGYNIINLKAEDKFGHGDEKNYQIIYK